MKARPDACIRVKRALTQKRPIQARGCTSGGIHTRAQGEHTEKGIYRNVVARPEAYTQTGKCKYRHLDARPEAYTHVHMAYTPKRAGTGAFMHVQKCTHT